MGLFSRLVEVYDIGNVFLDMFIINLIFLKNFF